MDEKCLANIVQVIVVSHVLQCIFQDLVFGRVLVNVRVKLIFHSSPCTILQQNGKYGNDYVED